MGSTRWRNYKKKRCVEDALAISIHPLQKHISVVAQTGQASQGTLLLTVDGQPTKAAIYIDLTKNGDSVAMRLRYGISGDTQREFDYTIALEGMTSNLIPEATGRWYFVCPQCEQRRTKLYLPLEATTFACRRCHNLTYRSCQEEHQFDGLLKAASRNMGLDEKAVTLMVNALLLGK